MASIASMAKPPTVAELRWKHALVFDATSGSTSLISDGNSLEGPSPVQLLAIALAGCMSTDLADILTKGRHAFRALRSQIVAERAQKDPHRFLRIALHFTVEGPCKGPPDAMRDAVARAIALSHEKYCSVWHSMRQDIALTTSFEVVL